MALLGLQAQPRDRRRIGRMQHGKRTRRQSRHHHRRRARLGARHGRALRRGRREGGHRRSSRGRRRGAGEKPGQCRALSPLRCFQPNRFPGAGRLRSERVGRPACAVQQRRAQRQYLRSVARCRFLRFRESHGGQRHGHHVGHPDRRAAFGAAWRRFGDQYILDQRHPARLRLFYLSRLQSRRDQLHPERGDRAGTTYGAGELHLSR